MERLSEKTRELLHEFIAHAKRGLTGKSEGAYDNFLDHLAALEKEIADLREWKENATPILLEHARIEKLRAIMNGEKP